MDVRGKVVIITGASSGVGEATAKLLSDQGALVVLAARNKDKLEQLEHELPNSFAIPTDVTQEIDRQNLISKTLEHFSRIDILINNAGRGYDATIEEIDLQKFRELFELDLLSYVSLMQKVIPEIRKQNGGAIVNISSGTALMNIPGVGVYSSLKRAIVGLSLTAREELKNDNINVSVIYPFITKTNFYKNVLGGPRENLIPQGRDIPEADTAEHVAQKILQAIKTGEAEIYAHEWMRRGRDKGVQGQRDKGGEER